MDAKSLNSAQKVALNNVRKVSTLMLILGMSSMYIGTNLIFAPYLPLISTIVLNFINVISLFSVCLARYEYNQAIDLIEKQSGLIKKLNDYITIIDGPVPELPPTKPPKSKWVN